MRLLKLLSSFQENMLSVIIVDCNMNHFRLGKCSSIWRGKVFKGLYPSTQPGPLKERSSNFSAVFSNAKGWTSLIFIEIQITFAVLSLKTFWGTMTPTVLSHTFLSFTIRLMEFKLLKGNSAETPILTTVALKEGLMTPLLLRLRRHRWTLMSF